MLKQVLAISFCICLGSALAFCDTFGSGENQFSIDFVDICADTNPKNGYGIVDYDYRMGVYEITNAQWDKFVAAVGTVTGSPAVAYDQDSTSVGADMPANRISWYEAAQFVNYLNTISGYQAAYNFTGEQGTTEYTFATWSVEEAWGGTNLYRHKDAQYFLPSEDEWVKAAFWNGENLQKYATVDDADPINSVDTNYDNSGMWIVGSGSEEINGTFDMMGNANEWMENPFDTSSSQTDSNRTIKGGNYRSITLRNLESDIRADLNPENEYGTVGFRVAAVPEPSSLLVFLLGSSFLARTKKQKG